MLARRFTIVCLLMALFGMLFSILVEQTGRKGHSWQGGTVVSHSMVSGPARAGQAA